MPGVNVPMQGMNQQSPANQQLILSVLGSRAARSATGRKRSSSRKATRRTARGTARTTRRKSSTRKALRKGSAAAKAWGRRMKALRKKRG